MADATLGQERIWRHFQNVAPESFADAHPRQDYIARRIRRRVRRRGRGRGLAAGGAAVLNIGIGDGYLERRLLELGCAVSSLDPDAGAVARLLLDGVDARAGSVDTLPFDAGRFDCVVASEVLEHLSADQRRDGLHEVARVLRRSGWFVGTVPYRERLELGETVCPGCGHVFHRWGHQASFDRPAIAAAMPERLRVIEARPTAFGALAGRGAFGLAKSVLRTVLARLGEPIAQPTLFFIAEKT